MKMWKLLSLLATIGLAGVVTGCNTGTTNAPTPVQYFVTQYGVGYSGTGFTLNDPGVQLYFSYAGTAQSNVAPILKPPMVTGV